MVDVGTIQVVQDGQPPRTHDLPDASERAPVLALGANPLMWPYRISRYHADLHDAVVNARMDVFDRVVELPDEQRDEMRTAVAVSVSSIKWIELRARVLFELYYQLSGFLKVIGLVLVLILGVWPVGGLRWYGHLAVLFIGLCAWIVAGIVMEAAQRYEVRWRTVRTFGVVLGLTWVVFLAERAGRPRLAVPGGEWMERAVLVSTVSITVTVGGIALATVLALLADVVIFAAKDRAHPEDALIDNLVWLLYLVEERIVAYEQALAGGGRLADGAPTALDYRRDVAGRSWMVKNIRYAANAFETGMSRRGRTRDPMVDAEIAAFAGRVAAAVRRGANELLLDERRFVAVRANLSSVLVWVVGGDWTEFAEVDEEQAPRVSRAARVTTGLRVVLAAVVPLAIAVLALSGVLGLPAALAGPLALYGFLTFGVQVLGWLDPKAPSRLSEQASQVASITDGLSKVLKAGKP